MNPAWLGDAERVASWNSEISGSLEWIVVHGHHCGVPD